MFFGKAYLTVVSRGKAVSQPSELSQLEDWLSILMATYNKIPSISLAKVITYYIERIVNHDDFELKYRTHCQYVTMRKYWHWLCYQQPS